MVNTLVKILLDHAGMSRLVFGWETVDYDLYYVADAPARVIVAFQNGLDPKSLTWAVVEAHNEEEIGIAGRVRPANVGKQHSTLTVSQRVNGPPDNTLSQVLAAGMQDEV